MFAFFGLGTQELLLLGVLALIGGGAVLLIVFLTRGARRADRTDDLEDENRRLRERLDRTDDKRV
jgi:hypothetical protein